MICELCKEDHFRVEVREGLRACEGCGEYFRADNGIHVIPCEGCGDMIAATAIRIDEDACADKNGRCDECHEERIQIVADRRADDAYEASRESWGEHRASYGRRYL
jgi:Zn finger protein HypA/HybF involved in hydrogenase expression